MSMTESEAIKKIRKQICNEKGVQRYCTDNCMYGTEHCAYSVAIQALEEVGQYRAIGLTPEWIEAMKGHNIALINDLGEYQQIGTIERFKELTEKAEPKKPRWYGHHFCPNCSSIVYVNCGKDIYCPKCGQRLDWE